MLVLLPAMEQPGSPQPTCHCPTPPEPGDTLHTWLDHHPQLVEGMVLPCGVHVLAQEGPSRGSLQARVGQTWAETNGGVWGARPDPCTLRAQRALRRERNSISD